MGCHGRFDRNLEGASCRVEGHRTGRLRNGTSGWQKEEVGFWGGGSDSGFTRSFRMEFVGRIGHRVDDVRTRGTVGFAPKRGEEGKARLRK